MKIKNISAKKAYENNFKLKDICDFKHLCKFETFKQWYHQKFTVSKGRYEKVKSDLKFLTKLKQF